MKQTLITDYYKSKKSVKYNPNTWYCIICKQDLGEINPRQYCRKTYCENEIYENI